MPTPSEGTALIARANLYRFFADVFSGRACDLTASERELMVQSISALGAHGVEAPLRHALEMAAQHGAEATHTAWARLLGRPAASDLPPYSSRYGTADLGAGHREMQLLADVSGFLQAFGLNRSGLHTDREDHVALELEFVALLCTREVAATNEGLSDRAEVVREARRRFLADHLGRFAFGFGEALERRGDAILLPFARALRSLVAHDFQCLGLAIPAAAQVRLPVLPVVNEEGASL